MILRILYGFLLKHFPVYKILICRVFILLTELHKGITTAVISVYSYNQVTDSSLTEKREKFQDLSQLQLFETPFLFNHPLLTDNKNVFFKRDPANTAAFKHTVSG